MLGRKKATSAKETPKKTAVPRTMSNGLCSSPTTLLRHANVLLQLKLSHDTRAGNWEKDGAAQRMAPFLKSWSIIIMQTFELLTKQMSP